MDKNILLICGSLNQTTMMHQIAQKLPEYNCFFTPYYATGLIGKMAQIGLLNFSVLGGRHYRATQQYLAKERLQVDFGGKCRNYDLVITCSDLIVPKNIRGKRLMLVQEGMTEPEDFTYQLVRTFKLPLFFANTAATGLSNAYDVFCVASPGYRDLFIRKGVKPEKIIVTGIPNFDHADSYLDNNFPYMNFVLAATSSLRETMKPDHRQSFLRQVKQIAGNRQVIFKLHPNENIDRAKTEIRSCMPEAMILSDGNLHQMIANCDVLVAQRTTAVYTGIALGKEVHSDFDLATLKKLQPIQNNGTSAKRIAEVCKEVIRTPVIELRRPETQRRISRKWQFSNPL
jgi:hypothetical protein